MSRAKRDHVRGADQPNAQVLAVDKAQTIRRLVRRVIWRSGSTGSLSDGSRDEEASPRRSWHEAVAEVRRPDHLRRTVATALIVGTILFAINQLNVVIAGHATTFLWFKVGLTYLVPFAVSNVGVLIATRRTRGRRG